jgi:predicted histone-like DNA-binding protein
MPINFTVIEKGQPGVVGGGQKKYYASRQSSRIATLDDITKAIEKSSTVSGADIRAVLYALVEHMNDELADGAIVRLGELGSMRVKIQSSGEAKASDVSASSIVNTSVHFTPGKRIKETLRNLEFKKV